MLILHIFQKEVSASAAPEISTTLAIAAIILALLKSFWPDIKTFFQNNVKGVIGDGGNDKWNDKPAGG